MIEWRAVRYEASLWSVSLAVWWDRGQSQWLWCVKRELRRDENNLAVVARDPKTVYGAEDSRVLAQSKAESEAELLLHPLPGGV